MTEEEDTQESTEVPTASSGEEGIESALEKLADSISEEELSEIAETVEEETTKEYHITIPDSEISVDLEEDLYGWNNDFELVAGEDNTLSLCIQNESEEAFPGAVLDEIRLSGPSTVTSYTGTVEMPEIPSGEQEWVDIPMRVTIEGGCGIHAKIDLDGVGRVVVDGVDNNEINEAFRAVPRERLQMVSKLTEIQESLEDL